MIKEYTNFLLDRVLLVYRIVAAVICVSALIILGINDFAFAALMVIPIIILYLIGFMVVGFAVGFLCSERVRYDIAVATLQREIAAGRVTEDDAEKMLLNIDDETISQGTSIIEFGRQFGSIGENRMFEYLVGKMDTTGDTFKFMYFSPVESLPEEGPDRDIRWYIDFEGIRYVREQ